MDNKEWAENLYNEHYERLFALGFAFVSGNPMQVQKLEDAIQEVFYELIKKSDTLMKHENIAGWLVVTLRLKLKEQYKKQKRDDTVKKCFTILASGFETAKKWHYISEIPKVTAPTEKTVKRRAWDSWRVFEVLDSIKEDELLHLAVHLAFVCSLRAGETAGIDLHTIDFRDGSLWITRQIQRISDNAIGVLPKHEVLRIFPKQVLTSKSSMILKGPKTEDSHRKQYLTTPLLDELHERLERIEENKAFFRDEYLDYGLLICHADGRPVDPKSLEKSFKEHQKRIGIPENERIDFQGLRKSGQMHKVRLSQNNYQLVAENAGQSPEVLMNHYNEALDYEKRALSRLVENSFYPHRETHGETQGNTDMSALIAQIQQNPELCRKLMQSLTLDAQQNA